MRYDLMFLAAVVQRNIKCVMRIYRSGVMAQGHTLCNIVI